MNDIAWRILALAIDLAFSRLTPKPPVKEYVYLPQAHVNPPYLPNYWWINAPYAPLVPGGIQYWTGPALG